MLPLVAYALFGSSRQLIVGPDSATCAMVAATLLPLAAQDPQRYADYSVVLAIFVGVLSVVGGVVRLGFIADFLSRPILTGFLNGIGISIIVGQLGKLFGIRLTSQEFLAQMIGVQRPALSVAMRQFKDAGLVRYARGEISIADRDGLLARSCGCTHVIAAESRRLDGMLERADAVAS